MEQPFVMGWDGGSSKTIVSLLIQGQAAEKFLLPTLKAADGTLGQTGRALEELQRELTRRSLGWGECRALCAGLAGLNEGDLGGLVTERLTEQGFRGRLKLTGDFEIALWGALGQLPASDGKLTGGAVLISGIGAICFGQAPDGRRKRCGGYGPWLDEDGSGVSIGREILRAIVRADDGRGPKTALTQLVWDFWRVTSCEELRTRLRQTNDPWREMAKLAPLLDLAAATHDEASEHIIRRTIQSLLLLLAPVYESLGLSGGELGLEGGILRNSAAVRSALDEAVRREYADLKVFTARQSPEDAALRYAEREASW